MRKHWILPLPPNRVRRNYLGGALLERWEGNPDGTDGDRPEDWLASTTPARNPGLPPIEDEGIATVRADGQILRVSDLFAAQPDHWLGREHVASVGPQPGFLMKLLDSSMRLHVQAHPTRQFAREHLDSRWGKLETYVVLAVRDGTKPFIRLGFQHAPEPEEWRRIVLEQDIAAMDACFEPVPVHPGEVWVIPGGLPHAIGPGLLVLETMEPTDLVVRCEFEREGLVVPPEARFMGRDPDFALGIFELTSRPVSEIRDRYQVVPRVLRSDRFCTVEELIGSSETDCFTINRIIVSGRARYDKTDQIHVGVVTSGDGQVGIGAELLPVRQGSRFIVPAAAEVMDLHAGASEKLELALARPGSAYGSEA